LRYLSWATLFFDLPDDLDGRVDPYIGADQGIFQVIQHFLVDAALAGDHLGEPGKKSLLGFFPGPGSGSPSLSCRKAYLKIP